MTDTIEQTTSRPSVTQIGEAIGEAGLTVRELDWSILAQDGLLVDLNIHQATTASKTNMEDLGMESATEEEQRAITTMMGLGYRWLLPAEQMEAIYKVVNQGRANLLKYAFVTTSGKFVPLKRYRAWREANDALRAEFLALVADLDQNWDEYRAQSEAEYRKIAGANFRRLRENGYQPMTRPTPGTTEQPRPMSLSEYTESYVLRTLLKLKGREDVVREYSWGHLATLVDFGATQALVSQARERSIDALALADIERTAKSSPNIDKFMAEITGEVRTRIYDVVVSGLAAMRKGGGKLPGGTVAALRSLIQTVEDIKFWPEAELDARMADLRSRLEASPDQRSEEELKAALVRLGTESRLYLLGIDKPPKRSGAEFGIPDRRSDLTKAVKRGSVAKKITTPKAAPVADVTPEPEPVAAEPVKAGTVDLGRAPRGRGRGMKAPLAAAAPSATPSYTL